MKLDPRERRVREEMRHHLDELRRQLESEGWSPEDASAEAGRRFGDPEAIARRTSGGATWARAGATLDGLRRDLGFALRQLRRRPLHNALVVGTLVVGVSATAIVYSVVHAVVLSPLPYARPERVVHVAQTSPQGRLYSTSEPNFVDFRARQRSFTDMGAMAPTNPILSGIGPAESVEGLRVSHGFFPVLGIEPILGRGFTESEDTFGRAHDVVLLSEGAWARRFGRDPDVIGRTIVLDGTPREVVGVIPSDRAWPGVEVLVPLAANPDVYRDDQRLETVARLAPGVTLEEARADMSAIAARLSDEYPQSNEGWGAAVRSAREWRIGDRLTRLGGVLLGAVGLFLLMTCATISNLLLARASGRSREMGVRQALGAGRARITGQLLTEGAVLAVVGGALALVLTHEGLRVVQAFGPGDITRLGEATAGGTVLLVTLATSVLTVLVASVAPVLLLRGRGGRSPAIRGGRADGGTSGHAMRDALVVTQFALAVTVVSGAGLLARSFAELQAVDPGFAASGTIRFWLRLPDDRFDQEARADHLERLATELGAIPGVRAVGATTAPPFSRMRPSNFVARSDREPDRQEDFLTVSWRAVTEGYFAALGIPLISGRTFGPEDRFDRDTFVEHPPVVIDRALADQLWPDGEDPVGRFVTWFLPGGAQCVVIGVVASTRDERLDAEPRPRIYRPFTFSAWDQPAVLVRTEGDPSALIPAVREAALRLDPNVPAIDPAPLEQDVSEAVAWPRFSLQVFGVFALVALVLAAMGIYGVTAFSVARRRHEIGVRVALGAEPSGVRWLVLRRGLRLAVLGVLIGSACAFGLAGLLGATILYDVSPRDPVTFVTVPVVLLVVALASTWIPARRALRLDPREALVSE